MSSLSITPHPNRSGVYRLECGLLLEEPIEEVFAYFSTARNLETLTPSFMKFEVVTPEPIDMRAGTLIDYRLKVHHVPLNWQSEIIIWEPPQRFVDEQRKGPYKLWHHEHLFEERDGGTFVRDCVDYAVPGGWLINRLFIQGDLKRIFAYRSQQLAERFTPVSMIE